MEIAGGVQKREGTVSYCHSRKNRQVENENVVGMFVGNVCDETKNVEPYGNLLRHFTVTVVVVKGQVLGQL